jgi:hypothetical protein
MSAGSGCATGHDRVIYQSATLLCVMRPSPRVKSFHCQRRSTVLADNESHTYERFEMVWPNHRRIAARDEIQGGKV